MLTNIKDENQPKSEGVPPDAFMYFDHVETSHHIQATIESDGRETKFPMADLSLPPTVQEYAPDDICPNIAEGLSVDTNEVHVPALLEITTYITNRELG